MSNGKEAIDFDELSVSGKFKYLYNEVVNVKNNQKWSTAILIGILIAVSATAIKYIFL